MNPMNRMNHLYRPLRARYLGPALRTAAAPPVAAALLLAPAAPASAAGEDGPAGRQFTAEESETQAALVTAEDHRLDQVRAVAAVVPPKDQRYTKPYRAETAGGHTLVLTRRSRPQLDYGADAISAAAGADVVLLTEWNEFRRVAPEAMVAVVNRRRIADGRHALEPARWRAAGWEYRALGRPRRTGSGAQRTGKPKE